MCGIAGIVNLKKTKFNKPLFNILGIANDERGKDSCGIFIDGEYEYGVDKRKLYKDFFYDSELLKKTTVSKTAFLHCRKASIGKIGLETAQPVIITEDDEVKFCVIHNGTIHNYEALAKKYIPEINIKGMTDSQVMARIFYYKGYDVLSEYNGGAVFAIADYREDKDNPKIYFWKGASKEYSTSKEASEERPFFHVQTKTCFVFSSIATHLDATYGEKSVFTITENNLIELRNNELYVVKHYDRSNCQQGKIYTTTYNYNTNKHSSSNTNNNKGWWGSTYDTSNTSYIYMNKVGDYMSKGAKLHGKKFCSAHGTAFDYSFEAKHAMWVYFYHGILLYNEYSYNLIEKIREGFAAENKKYLNSEKFFEDYPEIVAYFSYLPLTITEDNKRYFEVNFDFMWEVYTGQFCKPFHVYERCECDAGVVKKTAYSTALEAFALFKTTSDSFYIEKDGFIDHINKIYNVSIKL